MAFGWGSASPASWRWKREKSRGTVTLTSLRRAAEALDCTLVYAFLPNKPLVATLQERAEIQADAQLKRVDHTMRLENQALTRSDLQRQRELLIDQLLRGPRKRLWDEPA